MEREIIHVDIAAFAVAVERVVHPELRMRPVIVAPVGPPRSVVMALSKEAWEAGIRKGMILAKALRYCRDAVVLPPNEPLYARASRAICKVLENFSPLLEPAGYVQLTNGLKINLERSSGLPVLEKPGRRGFALPASSPRQGLLEEVEQAL